jgi:hypothetical protein
MTNMGMMGLSACNSGIQKDNYGRMSPVFEYQRKTKSMRQGMRILSIIKIKGGETMTQEEFVKDMIEKGYFDSDCNPLKCHKCESDKMKTINSCYEEGFQVEFEVMCEECHTILGYWSYGGWVI